MPTQIARNALRGLLLAVAGIHVLPVSGLAGAGQLSSLYGVEAMSPDVVLLLRHRAVLFAIVAGLLVAAAFRPALLPAALVAGFASVGSFLLLALPGNHPNPAVQGVIAADIVALLLLLLSCCCLPWASPGRRRIRRPPATAARRHP